MAESIVLNNYSDDSKIKEYIMDVLMPRVFHDIPLNILNTGQFSIINEYMSQALENLAFTSSFYFNESFITKAALSDSIYAEGAIFNIGYAFATPTCCNVMLELRIADLLKNSTFNPDNGLYEFILDKNTKFNLKNGNVYSLDYDILVQYKNVETATLQNTEVPAWNVQYTNMQEQNSIAVNKTPYILYRVSETWLCLFLKVSEFERETHIVVNNMTNGIPNADEVITCQNHIAGFDVKYIDGDGTVQYLDRDHILAMHADVKDQGPYVHYIMDSPQTIRFKFQLNGTRYFVPKLNSSFEFTIYTCHGEAANFEAYKTFADEQPSIITASNRFSNNGNVMKAGFIISGSKGGTNIGTIETVRRETIEAYNTANVISTDHDIYEWFKTFFFKRVLYPFFFKRRDDPWGKVWSGFLALKDTDDTVFRTNTVHARIPYSMLASNGTLYDNEMIIPPGIVWVYTHGTDGRYTVTPPTAMNTDLDVKDRIFEMANRVGDINEPFVFANPFGIRIQKDPFAVGYFNPWINESVTASIIPKQPTLEVTDPNDHSIIYHATPTTINVKRSYQNNYYLFTALVSPTTKGMYDGTPFITQLRSNSIEPTFSNGQMWAYVEHPTDLYSKIIPILPLTQKLTFDPLKTYLCVKSMVQDDSDTEKRWRLSNCWIEDRTDSDNLKVITLPMNGISYILGDDALWGNAGVREEVKADVANDITIYPDNGLNDAPVEFRHVEGTGYYEMRIRESEYKLISITTVRATKTDLTKYSETTLWRIGERNQDVSITIHAQKGSNESRDFSVTIKNSANVYIPFDPANAADPSPSEYIFNFDTIYDPTEQSIVLYADMKPAPSADSVDYYRVPFSAIGKGTALMYLVNAQLDLSLNNLRVVMATKINGIYTGRLEMTPVQVESDGTVVFQTIMYPINQLVDSDNRINIASTAHNGGSWIPAMENGMVSIDATAPDIELAVLFRSDNVELKSYTEYDNSFIGFRLADRWKIDDLSLIQELKEMRSVVKFDEFPNKYATEDEFAAYNGLISFMENDPIHDNLYTIWKYANDQLQGIVDPDGPTFADLIDGETGICQTVQTEILSLISSYENRWVLTGLQIKENGANYDANNVRIKFTADTLSNELYFVKGGEYDKALARVVPGPAYKLQSWLTDSSDIERKNPGAYINVYGDEYVSHESTDPSMYAGQILDTEIVGDNSNHASGLQVSFSGVKKESAIPSVLPFIQDILAVVQSICDYDQPFKVDWEAVVKALNSWKTAISTAFEDTGVNASTEIQLMPVVKSTLMTSDRFDSFVSAFTEIHKAIEPVIFKRLEGNNYLDCKLIATYGYPHSYASDMNKKLYDDLYANSTDEETISAIQDLFWPSLDIQIEFDVKLFNPSLQTVTMNELRGLIKSYFNRLTSIHTPIDVISMDNNIYISQLIQQLEAHPNVAYLKFKGWYTDERGIPGGKYMNADYQCIVQMWDAIDHFPKKELERYVPEMFVLEDHNIVLNML